jgi:eukaryotic-like serine/threonine-protein kinase
MPIDPQRVRDVFLSAAELPDPERASYLDRACGPDAELRAAVERLLAAHAAPAGLLESPAANSLSLTGPHTPQPDTGTILAGRYKLLEQIGEGGMGSVWVAQQTEPVKRTVAVKLIKPGMDSKTVLARFDAERQALALMDHPNIAKVLDAGAVTDGRPFFVMELVKGVPITKYCDARRLTPRERLELFVPVCHAVQHAHQKGIIHRDLKPSNVLVALYDDRPVPKVIDFGVAKATGQPLTEHTLNTGFGTVVGTPQYMSPEQATFNNLDVDTRSDLYSLGVLLYELLAGSPPFSKKDLEVAGVMEMLRVVREEEPPRPSTKLSSADALPSLAANRSTEPRKLTGMLRNELDWIVMKALEKDRTRRYGTANGFAADILRYLSGEPVQAVPPSLGYRMRKFVRRHKGPVVAALLVLMVLMAGIAGTTLGLIRADAAWESEFKQRIIAEDETVRANGEADHARIETQKAKDSEEAEKLAVRKAHRLLGLMNTNEGLRLIEEGHLALGLLKTTSSLSVAQHSPTAVAIARNQFANYRQHTHSAYRLTAVMPQGGLKEFAVSPDARRILTTGHGIDKTARVWDGETGIAITPPLQHDNLVLAAVFSPDSKRVVTGSYDKTARVWDAETGRLIAPPLKHESVVQAVAYSPDGPWVLTGSFDKTARVWDANTGKEVLKFTHTNPVTAVAYSPDGHRIVTGSKDIVRVWDAVTGKEILPALPLLGEIQSVAFSVDGTRIMTWSLSLSSGLKSGGGVQAWDAKTGKLLSPPLELATPLVMPKFSADGRRAITVCKDNTTRVWDLDTGKVLLALEHLKTRAGVAITVALSPDGRRVLTGHGDYTVQVWDFETGKPISPPLQHGSGVRALAFMSDGRRIITGAEGVTRVWDVETDVAPTVSPHVQPPPFEDTDRVWAASYSADGLRIVTGSSNYTARVWDVASGRAVTPPLQHLDQVRTVAFSPDGRRVITGSDDRTAQVWDLDTGKSILTIAHTSKVTSVAFSPDGKQILTASQERTAKLWDAETGKMLKSIKDTFLIRTATFFPDGRRALTEHGDTLLIWDLETEKVIATIPVVSRMWSVALSSDGKRVLTGGTEGISRIYDVESGKPLTPLLKQGSQIASVAFSPDGRRVVTGSVDKTARVWDAETGMPLSPPLQHLDKVRAVAFSLDGRSVLTWTNLDTLRKWDVSADDRPAADVIGLAQLFSSHRCDETGSIIPLTVEELSALWSDLHARYPAEFIVRPEIVRRWREKEIRDCMNERNLAAAEFHYWALAAELASGKAR